MRFSELPRSAQAYVATVCGLALALTVATSYPSSAGASFQLFVLLVFATSVAHSFPVSAPGKQAYHVSLPFFIAALVLLAPLQLAALFGAVHVAESFRRRQRSLNAQVFNTATYILAGLLAQATYRALWSGQADTAADLRAPACLLAGLAAAMVFAFLNRVLVSGAIWLGNRISPRHQGMFEPEGLLTDGAMLLMGLPLAQLAELAPWAAAVGAVPLWLIHRALDLPNIRAQSRRDGLTELFTTPYLTETCTRELNRGRRFNRPVSLLLLDVDGLAALNAAHGQQAGEVVLRGAARAISYALREYDLPARLAGGLFAVLLPETDLAQVQAVAERIRRTVAEQRHEVPGGVEEARVTISIGGAVVNGHQATSDQLFEAARTALARAKQEGGNQVSFETVHAALLTPVTDEQEPAAPPVTAIRRIAWRKRRRSYVPTVVREHGQSIVLGVVAAAGLTVCAVGAIASLDWGMLAVMLSLAALAGLAFYFKSLPLALALANEVHQSSLGLLVQRYWRMWPQYVSLGIASLLVFYAAYYYGVAVAIALGILSLIVRRLAGRYVDRTLESVRKLRTANEALEHKAFHDPLTNLPNRALFSERLQHAMLRAGDCSVAVLFLDLDNFKTVNDTLGHAAGDALLVAATERLLECVRREDTIARFGGDEFTVLLEAMRDPSDAARMAERISEALRRPFDLRGAQVSVSSSIGIALDTDRSHRPDDLLREADLAMYRAKTSGKARYEIFDTGMAERAMERLDLEMELRNAADRGELVLRYRPVVSLSLHEIEGLEAELYWRHPRRGMLAVDAFLTVAEESGISLDLGRWTIEQACRDARQWQPLRQGLPVQVDLSPRQLEQPELAAIVGAALATAGLSPACLQLEVAESAIARADESTRRVLSELHAMGVRVALDNVGAGVSSLARISNLPIDVLKMDASAEAAPSLVRIAVAMASALNVGVTAQGLVNPDQPSRLAALGCASASGELYGPALSIEAVRQLVAAAPSGLRVA